MEVHPEPIVITAIWFPLGESAAAERVRVQWKQLHLLASLSKEGLAVRLPAGMTAPPPPPLPPPPLGAPIVNAAVADSSPPPRPARTLMEAVPSAATSEPLITAVRRVLLTRVVGRGEPCHSTTALDVKPEPLTVRVIGVPSADARAGASEEMVGSGCWSFRSSPLFVSATSRSPDGSSSTFDGSRRLDSRAGPVVLPAVPVPATVEMTPSGAILRIRWFSESGK